MRLEKAFRVPSYRAIAMALLKCDPSLKALGFSVHASEYLCIDSGEEKPHQSRLFK